MVKGRDVAKLGRTGRHPPMTLDALLQFLRREIRMSHIYQPLLIRTLLDNGGFCTRRQLALALLMQDESQIEYYEKRLRDMPLPVLRRRGVISESDGIVRLEVDKLSLQDGDREKPGAENGGDK